MIDMDGKALHYSGTVLTFYLAPGHTAEGLMIVWEPAGVLIAGDYLSNIEFPFIEDNITSYRRTMSKIDRILRAHQVKWMVPGHGDIAYGMEEISSRKEVAIEYLDDLELARRGEPFPEAKYRQRYPDWNQLREMHLKQVLGS
jgi:glyoxylase-like metal-dependent hydrolase (beta-lactamase superfamily II)